MKNAVCCVFILAILLNCAPERKSLTKEQALKIHQRLLTIDTHACVSRGGKGESGNAMNVESPQYLPVRHS